MVEKRFSVSLRTDMGDQFEDTSLGIFYGESKFDVKTHIEGIHGIENKYQWYIIEEV